mmetsp:Transcript_23539/g.75060  ORF Transcript_23539/g.75060 Transcript_23539/m.75060 type:complete len:220 (+) Transcript_23539:1294-1953(+)
MARRSSTRSRRADLAKTPGVGHLLRAVVNSSRACSTWPVSHSSLNAASHTRSLLCPAANARCRNARAPSTSPEVFQVSLAAMSQNSSALGHRATACSSKRARVALSPCLLSNAIARISTCFCPGNRSTQPINSARAVSSRPAAAASCASLIHVRRHSCSSSPSSSVAPTIARAVTSEPLSSASMARASQSDRPGGLAQCLLIASSAFVMRPVSLLARRI